MSKTPAARVLNQNEIDGLLGFDEDAQDPPPPDALTVCRSILRQITGWDAERVEIEIMEERAKIQARRQSDERAAAKDSSR